MLSKFVNAMNYILYLWFLLFLTHQSGYTVYNKYIYSIELWYNMEWQQNNT